MGRLSAISSGPGRSGGGGSGGGGFGTSTSTRTDDAKSCGWHAAPPPGPAAHELTVLKNINFCPCRLRGAASPPSSGSLLSSAGAGAPDFPLTTDLGTSSTEASSPPPQPSSAAQATQGARGALPGCRVLRLGRERRVSFLKNLQVQLPAYATASKHRILSNVKCLPAYSCTVRKRPLLEVG